MPSFFRMIGNAASATSEFVGGIINDIDLKMNAESLEKMAKSGKELAKLQILMEQLQSDSSLTLREKKTHFLEKAPSHILYLTTADIVKLFDAFQTDKEERLKKYFFIYAEDSKKPIGWIKKNMFFEKKPTGHTETHKKFLGMLKERALLNIVKISVRSQRYKQELREVERLMEATRGRVGNAFVWMGSGYEGEYKNIF